MTTGIIDSQRPPAEVPPLTPAQCEMIAARAEEYAAAIQKEGLSPEVKTAVIAGALIGYYLGSLKGGVQ